MNVSFRPGAILRMKLAHGWVLSSDLSALERMFEVGDVVVVLGDTHASDQARRIVEWGREGAFVALAAASDGRIVCLLNDETDWWHRHGFSEEIG